MPTTLIVGIWSVDTVVQRGKAWLSASVDLKLARLNEALTIFHMVRTAQGNTVAPPDQLVRAVFVAPEYFFTVAKNNREKDRDYMDGFWFSWLKARIPAPPNVLLVPGSIAYRKTDDGGGVRRAKYDNNVAAVASLAGLLGDIRDVQRTNFIHNVAYGFFRGRKVLKARKQRNATDGGNDDDAFVPGWATNKAMIQVPDTAGPPRTLSFSIEICADASNHGGGTGYDDVVTPGPADVKILVSAVLAAQHVYAGNATRALIHACSDAQHSGITAIGAGVASTHLNTRQLYGGPLDCYRLTIP